MKTNKVVLITAIIFALIFSQTTVFCIEDYPTVYWVATSADQIAPNAHGEYEIRTPQQLAWVAGVVNGTITDGNLPLNTHNFRVRLMNDIDLGGKLWTPIGTLGRPYKGTFYGQNYCIRNLTINTNQSYQGLFGCYRVSSMYIEGIYDINVIDAKIIAGSQVGVIAGENCGYIHSCHATGTVTGYFAVGGLAGANYDYPSELIGGDSKGYIIDSSADVRVTGYNSVGGLVGDNDGIISSCYALGEVWPTPTTGTGYSFSLGGLVGRNLSGGTIENCYARGKVRSISPFLPDHIYLNTTGGLVGSNVGDSSQTVISNSYSTGEVNTVNSTNTGGFAGMSLSTEIINCYYNSQTSNKSVAVGMGDSTNIPAKTTSEMQAFDFQFQLNGDSDETVWVRYPDLNDGYPILKWQIENKKIDDYSESADFFIKDISYSATDVNVVIAVTGYECLQSFTAFLVSRDVDGRILELCPGETSNSEEITFILNLNSETDSLQLYVWDENTLCPYTEKLCL